MRGNCYVASEALYHLLGGRSAGWTPQVQRVGGDTHWYLKHDGGMILDVTRGQFDGVVDYSRGRGTGFLTRGPSRRARELMGRLVWQENA